MGQLIMTFVYGRQRRDPTAKHLVLKGTAGCEDISVKTIHVSCQSDRFQEDKDFIGIILYQVDGKTQWTKNNIRCKTGYVYFVRSDKLESMPGDTMHGKAYHRLFQEPPPLDDSLIASGFAYKDGQWKPNSTTFNAKTTAYAEDDSRVACNVEFEVLKKAIINWSNQGGQNFDTTGCNETNY